MRFEQQVAVITGAASGIGRATAIGYAARAVLPIMRAQGGGAIVNTSSISGLFGDRGSVGYNTVKAGVNNLTRVTALENAKDNIRCNAICPGLTKTALTAGLDKLGDEFFQIIPLGRAAEPEEIANVALFLASNLASYVTGAVHVIDGGKTLATGFS